MKFNVTPSHFEQLLKQSYSLDHIFLLKLVEANIDIQPLTDGSMKIAGLYQSLVRKGLVSDVTQEITQVGRELLTFADSEVKEPMKKLKQKSSDFDAWWNAFPSTDNFEHNGKKFAGSRGLKRNREECRIKFNKILAEGEYTADDIVNAGEGFGMHPHRNMEISTIVVAGSQAHKDNTGSEGIIHQNSVQTMSAGTGIMHSEFNTSKTELFHSYQIWVYPKEMNVKPRHEAFAYQPEDKLNKILLTLSPDRRKNTALINQDAFLSVSQIEKNITLDYVMNLSGNGVYIHCVTGNIIIDNYILNEGDALGIYETETINSAM
jgi:hypothetical protein